MTNSPAFQFCTGPAGEAGLSRSGEPLVAGAQSRAERESREPCARFRTVEGCARRVRRLRQAANHLGRHLDALGGGGEQGQFRVVPPRSAGGREGFRPSVHRGSRRITKVRSGLKSFRGAYLVNIFLTRVPVRRETAFQPIDHTSVFPRSPYKESLVRNAG